MTTYGVTSTGFVLKPLSVIKAEIEADQRANVSASLDQTADSPIGQLNAVFSEKLAEAWEVMQAAYSAQYPDSATGASLDEAASINGIVRLPATKSTVTLHVTGVNGTVLATGRKVSDPASGAVFVTTAPATIALGIANIPAQSQDFGPVIGNAATLTHIDTPVAGWATVSNVADAIVGRNIETDQDFRTRRIQLLSLGGSAAEEAIRSILLNVPGVSEVIVNQNDTDEIVDTLPPHSVECVVVGGTDAAIRAAIFASKSAGITAFGNTTGAIVDSNGISHEIDFTRPTNEVLSVNVVVLTDPAAFPTTGAQMIKDSLAAFADATYRIGSDVIRNKLFEPAFRDFTTASQLDIPGILDVTTLEIKFGGAFATANLSVTARQLATLDTPQITVTVTS